MSLDRTHEDVHPFLKDNWGLCGCGCGLSGTLKREWRDGTRCVARKCNCKRCVGFTSRKKGDTKARKMRKALGIAGANTRHEELWGGSVLTEMKAGLKAKTVRTAYENSRSQSDAAKSVGDVRPFLAGFSPDGTKHAYYVVRDDDLEAVVLGLAAMWGFVGGGE